MAQPQQGSPQVLEADAVLIGAGLSGIAAAIHLARSGFRVICIEQRKEIANTVGESLDWSAPDLFAGLGLPMDELISTEAATWKRHITVTRTDSGKKEYLPGSWLADPPWNVEIRTLHLDRERTDARLRETARRLGIVYFPGIMRPTGGGVYLGKFKKPLMWSLAFATNVVAPRGVSGLDPARF